ncbi:MAG TPA: hypothetical protein PLT66_06580 [Bacillota bacterium]|nr:hypothetical protein [Bacillota bacterium]
MYQTSNGGFTATGGYRPAGESEILRQETAQTYEAPDRCPAPLPPERGQSSDGCDTGGLFGGVKKLFEKIDLEDLLLIGIALLLLFDGEKDNDMLIILVLVLLLTD